METNPTGLGDYLRRDFANRRVKNPRFSLRSYAKHLGLSPSHLSLVLSKRREITAHSAIRIGEALGMSSTETLQLFRGRTSKAQTGISILADEEFSVVSRWYYFAILALASLRTNVADAKWIAKRLGLTNAVASEAFVALVAHGYLETKGGQFRRVKNHIRTRDDVPSAMVRRYHRQNLFIATEKIETVDVAKREFVSMTMAIDMRKLDAAKAKIREFKEEFTEQMESRDKTEVYNLCIQFFPLTLLPKEKA